MLRALVSAVLKISSSISDIILRKVYRNDAVNADLKLRNA